MPDTRPVVQLPGSYKVPLSTWRTLDGLARDRRMIERAALVVAPGAPVDRVLLLACNLCSGGGDFRKVVDSSKL